MGRKKNSAPPPPKKPAVQLRMEIKDYIRNRDSIGQKWKCLEEAVHSEDVRRTQFYNRKLKDNTRALPVLIQKFLSTLKRAVHLTMRHVGGTPFSIIRQMFLHWDANKRGALSEEDLDKCMKSLGVSLSLEDRKAIVQFYSVGNGKDEMHYEDLLYDIQKGEPGMLDIVNDEQDDHDELRFKTRDEDFAVIPPLVAEFIEAIRVVLMTKLRNEGGTPYSHLRNAFLKYDSSYASALSAEDLRKAMILVMGLNVSLESCRMIVRHYDRKRTNKLDYKLLLRDVCKDMPDFIAHKELTHDDVAKIRSIDSNNSFLPKPFKAAPNRVLEQFKSTVREVVYLKVCANGGSMKSWVKDAFICWDPRLTGKISESSHLMGVMKRLGVTLSKDDADQIMKCYDVDGSGQMTYAHVIDDLLEGEPAFVGGTTEKMETTCVTARAPSGANNSLKKIGKAAQLYTKKSKGLVDAKDVILGTFMRFDPSNTGRVSLRDVTQSMNILQVRGLSNRDIDSLVTWFDTNGSNQLDYHELIKQLYGEYDDVLGGNRQANALSSPTLPSVSTRKAPMDQIVFSDEPVAVEKTLPPLKAALQTAASLPPSLTESKLIKEARRAIRTKQILSEKVKIENKIAQIEKKKKALVESYKITHGGV